MNRIETRIIVMITNRLSAAKESEAKTELIEELSENLYQRYLDLAAGGMSEEEALSQAMESLGDTEELLAYLRDVDPEDSGEKQSEQGEKGEWNHEGAGRRETGGSFYSQDLEKNIEEIVNMAMSTARVAVDRARDVARDVSEQFKEKYPEGFSFQFGTDRETTVTVDCTSIQSENVHSVEAKLTNGDISLNFADDADAPIVISGDTEEIETTLRDDGVLVIRQGNTASSSFLFNRGMRASDIEICLPRRLWTNVGITTVNGDVEIEEGLECKTLYVQSASGDLEADRATGERMAFRTSSGDIRCRNMNGELYAETSSGDVELSGQVNQCGVSSISGDVQFTGACREISCTSTSGDIRLQLDVLPDKAKAASRSGDCQIQVPAEDGFRLAYRTASGEFSCNRPLTGTVSGKKGEADYLDGGTSQIQLSSTSGDISVRIRG